MIETRALFKEGLLLFVLVSGPALFTCRTLAQPYDLIEQFASTLEQRGIALQRVKDDFNLQCATISSSSVQSLQSCRNRKLEIEKEIKAYNVALGRYEKVSTRARDISSQLAILEARIMHTRGEISKYRTRDFQKSIDEWVELDSQAAEAARGKAFDVILELLIERTEGAAHQGAKIKRETMERLLGFSLESYAARLTRATKLGHLIADANKLEDVATLIAVIGGLKQGEAGARVLSGDSLGRQERLELALISIKTVNATIVRSPIIGLLVTDGELLVADAYLGLAKIIARDRLNQLSDLGTERLAALRALSNLYVNDLASKRRLNNEKAALLRD